MEFRLKGPVTVEPEEGKAAQFGGEVTIVPEGEELTGSLGEMASGSSSSFIGNCSSSSSSELGELGDLKDLSVGELVERARSQQRG